MNQIVNCINYKKPHRNSLLCRVFSFVMFVFCATSVMAQTRPTDFSGTWFVANNEGYALNNVNNYYLVPARDPKQEHFADAYFHNQYSNTSGSGDYTGSNYGDPEKPFITTHKNNASAKPENLIWRFGNHFQHGQKIQSKQKPQQQRPSTSLF